MQSISPLVLLLQPGQDLLETERAPALHVPLQDHPPVDGLLPVHLLVPPLGPFDLVLGPGLLCGDEPDQFLLDALLGAGRIYFHLEQLDELVAAVEHSLVAHAVTQFLPVDGVGPDAAEVPAEVAAGY